MSSMSLNELLASVSSMEELREHIMHSIGKPVSSSEKYAKEIFENYKKHKKENWVFCLSDGCIIDGIHCQPRLVCNENGMYVVIYADKVWTYRKNEHDDIVAPISQAVFTKTYIKKKSNYLLRDIVAMLDDYDKDISVMKLNKLHGVFHTPLHKDTVQLPPVFTRLSTKTQGLFEC